MNHFGSKWRLDYGSPRRLVKKICCSKWISQFNGLIKPQGTLFSLSNGLCRCICVLRCRRRLRLSSIITVNLPTTGRAKKKKKEVIWCCCFNTGQLLTIEKESPQNCFLSVCVDDFPHFVFKLQWLPFGNVSSCMMTLKCVLFAPSCSSAGSPTLTFYFYFLFFADALKSFRGDDSASTSESWSANFSCFRDSCPDLILLSRDVQTSSFEDRLQIKK